MRLYVEVARRTYARISTYRSATVAGVFTNTVFGFLLAYVLLARLQRARRRSAASTPPTPLTFTFVAQGLLMPLGLFGATEIADRISTGDVIVDLQRPYDHQAWWAAVEYGKAGFYLLFRGIPPFVAGALVFDLRLPDPAARPRLPGERRPGASAVAFGWRYLLQLSAFWLLDVRGPNQLGWLAAQFLSRRLHPDRVLPGLARDACAALLPFASMLQVPVEIWLGQPRGPGPRPGVRPPAGVGGRARGGGTARAGPRRATGGGAGWLSVDRRCASGGGWSAPGSEPTGSTAPRSSSSC